MVTVNENERTTSRAWVNTDTVNAYVVNTICVELYQANAKYTHTHTHSALAFQTRRVTSNCNYPRTTIIDCCRDFSPLLVSGWENTRFSHAHAHVHARTHTHTQNCALDAVCKKSDTPKHAIYTTTSCKIHVTCNGWVCYHVQLWTAEICCGVTKLSSPFLVPRTENISSRLSRGQGFNENKF
jgi:hypothetical protein